MTRFDVDKLYNGTRKIEFLETLKNPYIYYITLVKTEKYESIFNSDICDFNYDQLLLVFNNEWITSSQVRANKAYISKYTEWCDQMQYRVSSVVPYPVELINHQDVIGETRIRVLYYKDFDEFKYYLDKYFLVSHSIDNNSEDDSVCFEKLFWYLTWHGLSTNELINLKTNDIDTKEKIISLGSSQIAYQSSEISKLVERCAPENDFLFARAKKNKRTGKYVTDIQRVINGYTVTTQEVEFHNDTPKKLNKIYVAQSGLFSKIYQLEIQENIDVKENKFSVLRNLLGENEASEVNVVQHCKMLYDMYQKWLKVFFGLTEEKLYVTADVAEYLGVTSATINNWRREGKLQPDKIRNDGSYLYTKETMEMLKESVEQEQYKKYLNEKYRKKISLRELRKANRTEYDLLIQRIIDMKSDGISGADISRATGVTESQVLRIWQKHQKDNK